MLVQLQDWSGDIGHCCTTIGGWIFDVKYPHAFPLFRDLLNFVCRDPHNSTGMHAFFCIYLAIQFSQPKRTRYFLKT